MAITTPIHTNEQSLDRVLRAGVPVLLVFWQRSCPPCEQLTPTLERLAADYAGQALIAKIDAQEYPGLVRRYEVTRLPGLIFTTSGSVAARGSGAASESALRAWFDYLIHGGTQPAIPDGPSMVLGGQPAPPSAPTSTTTGTATGSGTPLVLTDATFDRVVGTGEQPVLVDFWAPWCGPCRMVAPQVERLAQEFTGRAIVAKINVDEHPRAAQRFGISGIPALFIFKNGKVVERLVGVQPASALRQALARHVRA